MRTIDDKFPTIASIFQIGKPMILRRLQMEICLACGIWNLHIQAEFTKQFPCQIHKGCAEFLLWHWYSFSFFFLLYSRFRPRILIDVSKIDMTTTILGFKISMPIMIAPTAMQKMAHPEGIQCFIDLLLFSYLRLTEKHEYLVISGSLMFSVEYLKSGCLTKFWSIFWILVFTVSLDENHVNAEVKFQRLHLRLFQFSEADRNFNINLAETKFCTIPSLLLVHVFYMWMLSFFSSLGGYTSNGTRLLTLTLPNVWPTWTDKDVVVYFIN